VTLRVTGRGVLRECVENTVVDNRDLVALTEGIGNVDVADNGSDITDTKLLYASDIIDSGNSANILLLLTTLFGIGFLALSSCAVMLTPTLFLLSSTTRWASSVVVLV